jgi:hypothetical protein
MSLVSLFHFMSLNLVHIHQLFLVAQDMNTSMHALGDSYLPPAAKSVPVVGAAVGGYRAAHGQGDQIGKHLLVDGVGTMVAGGALVAVAATATGVPLQNLITT